MNIVWKTITPRIGPSVDRAYIGNIHVGSANWSSTRSKDDPVRYDYMCRLPNTTSGSKPTLNEAKARVEEIIKAWFKHIENNS